MASPKINIWLPGRNLFHKNLNSGIYSGLCDPSRRRESSLRLFSLLFFNPLGVCIPRALALSSIGLDSGSHSLATHPVHGALTLPKMDFAGDVQAGIYNDRPHTVI